MMKHMKPAWKLPLRLGLTGLLVLSCVPATADEGFVQRLTLYQAHYSPDRMIDILRVNNPSITGHSRIRALAYTREFTGNPHGLSWELEMQAVRHSGIQTHPEINGLVSMRWNRLPWDDHVDTSIAFGSGMSYAFDMPELEPRSDMDDEESNRLLNYLLVEIDLSPPRAPQWGMVLRLHHRSGVFGLYNGVSGGSNFVGAGLRYAF